MSENRTAIYLRRSTDRQETSIEDQRSFLRDYAKRHNLAIMAEHVDDAISGDEARPGFSQMISMATGRDRPFDAIMTYDQSRFGRADAYEFGYYMHLLRQARVKVIFAVDPLPSEGNGSWGRVAAVINQEQKHELLLQLSRDTVRGLTVRVKEGFSPGMLAPFGYDSEVVDPAGKVRFKYRLIHAADKAAGVASLHHVWYPDGREEDIEGGVHKFDADRTRFVLGSPDAIKAVRRIFELYAARHIGIRALALQLNAEGIRSPGGGPWQSLTVRAILANPLYTGTMVWNRRTLSKYHKITRDGEGYRSDPKNYSLAFGKNEQSDWFIKPNAHPAIIAKALFEKVQVRLAERNVKYRNSGTAMRTPYMLSNFAHCAACGRILWGSKAINGKKLVVRHYHCSSKEKRPNRPCRGSLNAEELEFSLLDWTIKHFDLKRLRSAVRQKVRAALASQPENTLPDEVARLRADIRSLEVKRDAILDKVLVLSRQDLNSKLAEIQTEKCRLEKALAAAEAQAPAPALSLEARVDEVMALWDDLTAALKVYDKFEVQRVLGLCGVRGVRVDFARREVLVDVDEARAPGRAPSCGRIGSGGPGKVVPRISSVKLELKRPPSRDWLKRLVGGQVGFHRAVGSSPTGGPATQKYIR